MRRSRKIALAIAGGMIAFGLIQSIVNPDSYHPRPAHRRATVPVVETTTTTEAPQIDSASTVSIADWVSHSDDVQALEGIANDVATAAGNSDLGAVEAACQRGVNLIPGWQYDLLPTPWADVTEPLTRALDEYEAGFTDCAAGNIETSVSHITAGTAAISDATAALSAHNG